MVKIKDLKDQILTNDETFLFCTICESHYSANSGDYWDIKPSHVFTCCDTPMKLATQHTTLNFIK